MNIKYRPEIDGLRTIAVVSVLIYHTEMSFGSFEILKGGFFGVDIFFVISGFLITSLIMAEYHKTERFSILNFYERRIRRLFPALLLVILTSIPVAWVLLMPKPFVEYAQSLLYSLFFASNLFWYDALQAYDAESSLLKPFLHTWTLAVEEQYYIIYPLLLAAIYRYFKQHTIVLLAAGLLLSLQFAEIATGRIPSFSFYMLPSRFWELLSGGLLANILYFHPREDNDALLNRTMPVLGLFLIVHSVLFIDFDTNHPGFITLVPVVGTVLVIWFANERDLVTRMLASPVFVGIGLISYSLYLWHYPVFAFGRIFEPEPNTFHKLTWITLSAVLSVITYRLVERPFRRRQRVSLRVLLTTVLSGTVLVCAFALYAIQGDGLRERHSELIELYGINEYDNEALRERSWEPLKRIAGQHGQVGSEARRPSEFERNVRWFSDRNDTRKVLIVGNSHSKDLFNALYQNADEFPDMEFARFGMSPGVPDEQVDALTDAPNLESSDIVLISFRYSKKTLTRLPMLIRTLKALGKSVHVVSNTVEFRNKRGLPLFDWYLRQHDGDVVVDELKSLYYRRIGDYAADINAALKVISEDHSVDYLEKRDLVCDDVAMQCDGITPDGYKSLFDHGHWTLQGAKHFGSRIASGNWLSGE